MKYLGFLCTMKGGRFSKYLKVKLFNFQFTISKSDVADSQKLKHESNATVFVIGGLSWDSWKASEELENFRLVKKRYFQNRFFSTFQIFLRILQLDFWFYWLLFLIWFFAGLLEASYHSTNPFHNSIHAADVTQALHCVMQQASIQRHLTKLEIMSALLAAAGHDVDHPGVNQPFLVGTRNYLAALYNNKSVLENHHWRTSICLIRQSGLLDGLSPADSAQFEETMKTMILATDITRQVDLITSFHSLNDRKSFDEILADSEDRQFVLQIILKCADINNPCRPWAISRIWSQRWVLVFSLWFFCLNSLAFLNHHFFLLVLFDWFIDWSIDWSTDWLIDRLIVLYIDWLIDWLIGLLRFSLTFRLIFFRCVHEFFKQGDRERRLNLPVTAICDRKNNNLPRIQVGFIEYVVKPLFTEWERFLPNKMTANMMKNLRVNMGKWETLAEEYQNKQAEFAAKAPPVVPAAKTVAPAPIRLSEEVKAWTSELPAMTLPLFHVPRRSIVAGTKRRHSLPPSLYDKRPR